MREWNNGKEKIGSSLKFIALARLSGGDDVASGTEITGPKVFSCQGFGLQPVTYGGLSELSESTCLEDIGGARG